MDIIKNKVILVENSNSIIDPFIHSVKNHANNNALWVSGNYYSYADLYKKSYNYSNFLKNFSTPRCIIFSYRNFITYISIISSLLAGKAYVPLNPRIPLARNLIMLQAAKTNLIIIDKSSEKDAIQLLQSTEQQMNVILYEYTNLPSWTKELAQHRYFIHSDITNLRSPKSDSILNHNSQNDAVLLFTSGTTGIPKGVMLSHRNILSYISHTIERYQLTQNDRISQVTELTFDFSVQDIFASWSVGACVYAFPENYFIGFPQYIQNNCITFMTTVPSTVRLLHQLNKLQPNSFPSLRRNIFGGEPFTDAMAEMWQKAAPNSVIDNVCGPTEATIAFLAYPWNRSNFNNKRQCIPIGKPFPGQDILIVDDKLIPVGKGEIGELCLSGSQVFQGYWDNDALTQEKFFNLSVENKTEQRWYRTGDLAVWDENDGVIFKGRVDDQIKIRGYRIEKLEIEATLREIADTEFMAIVPWPIDHDGSINGLVGFMSHSKKTVGEVLKVCRQRLPDYMVPQKIFLLENLPLNINGKVDYLKLKTMLV